MSINLMAILVLVTLAAAVAAVVIAVSRLWGSRGEKADGGTCGRCGYAVRGLPTFSCPECGSDLREVGIKPVQPANDRTSMYVTLGLAAFVIAFVLCGGFFWAGSNSSARPAPTTPRAVAPPVSDAPQPVDRSPHDADENPPDATATSPQ